MRKLFALIFVVLTRGGLNLENLSDGAGAYVFIC